MIDLLVSLLHQSSEFVAPKILRDGLAKCLLQPQHAGSVEPEWKWPYWLRSFATDEVAPLHPRTFPTTLAFSVTLPDDASPCFRVESRGTVQHTAQL